MMLLTLMNPSATESRKKGGFRGECTVVRLEHFTEPLSFVNPLLMYEDQTLYGTWMGMTN